MSVDQGNLVSIAAMHEEYGIISKKGRIKRPFIYPVAIQSEKEIVENYRKAVEETFKK